MRADREEEFLQSVKLGHVRLVEKRDLVNPVRCSVARVVRVRG